MVKSKYIVTGVVAVAILVAVVIWLIPNEKKAIRRRFARLSELAAKNRNESLFTAAAQAKAFAELLTDPCELRGNIQSFGGTYSRREAAMTIAGIRSQFDVITLELTDIDIKLPEKNKASVTLTAKFTGARSGERIKEVRELDCALLKIEGKWLINSCQTVEIFQK